MGVHLDVRNDIETIPEKTLGESARACEHIQHYILRRHWNFHQTLLIEMKLSLTDSFARIISYNLSFALNVLPWAG